MYSEVLISNYKNYEFVNNKFILEEISLDLKYPWGMTFIDDDTLLITEKKGDLYKVNINSKIKEKINHDLEVTSIQQGGLLDILYHDDYVYFSYSHKIDKKFSSTAIARGNLINNSIKNLEIIFISKPKIKFSDIHFGSRIVLAPNNKLFITVGDRGDRRRAQDPFDHAGSTIRIYRDGSVPSDNPFADGKRGLPEIWSIGHRNAQGAIWNPVTNSLWTIAHGARGGDEVNHPEAGKNYGWPVISYGRNYMGSKIGEGTHKLGMEQPVYFWDPSIAPSGFAFYNGNAFPNWKGSLFVGALKFELIVRLELRKNKVISEERLFKNNFGRIRDVRSGPGEYLYFLTDENPGQLYRIRPN